ncbi:MAG: hypothetical protein ACLFQU_11715 [Candidatus Kapaibacterium sp.]
MKKSEKIIVIGIALILFALEAQAQLQTQLQINPRPSPYIADWQEKRETATYIVTNPTQNTYFVRLKTSIYEGAFSSGNLVAETNPAEMPVLTIDPGTRAFDPMDMIPYEAIDFYGQLEETIVRTGKLPSNDYTICTGLLDAETFEQLTEPDCRLFNITSYQAPILINPPDGEHMPQQMTENIIFRWTPVIPLPFEPVIYELAAFKVEEGQTPIQAFRANQPIFLTDAPGQTQQVWPKDYERPEPGDQIIWSVRAIDSRGNPIGEPEGRAEPFTFTVGGGECDCSEGELKLDIYQQGSIINEIAMAGEPLQLQLSHPGCGPGCGGRSDGFWEISFIAEDGETMNYPGAGEDFILEIPNSNGMLEILYSGIYICGGRPCSDAPVDIRRSIRIQSDMAADGDIITETGTLEIIPINPLGPCVGEATNEMTEGLVMINWRAIGPFRDFIIEIFDNPCGTYVPPYEPPTDKIKIGRMQKVRWPDEADDPSINKDDLERKTSSDPFIRETAAGLRMITDLVVTRYTPVGNERIFSSPPIGGDITAGMDGAQYNYELPMSEFVEPGAAFTYQIVGIADLGDGETVEVRSEPQCLRYRPVSEETFRPVEKIPCFPPDSIPPGNPRACGPSIETDKNEKIEIGMIADNLDLFKYPRAVAIRGDAIDWDIVRFKCEPGKRCPEDDSYKDYPVKDRFLDSDFEWVLNGKGSLNTPFELDDIKDKQKTVDSLQSLIDQKQQELDSVQNLKTTKLNTINAQKNMAQQQKPIVEDKINALEDSLKNVISPKINAERDTLATLSTWKNNVRDLITEKRDSIDNVITDSIKYWDKKLINEPGQEEKDLLDEIKNLRDQYDQAVKILKQKQKGIAERGQDLEDDIQLTAEDIRDTEKEREQIEENIAGLLARINRLRREMFKLGLPNSQISQAYLQRRNELENLTSSLLNGYFYQMSNFYADMDTLRASIIAKTEDIMATGSTQARNTLISDYQTMMTSFLDNTQDSCGILQDTTKRSLCSLAVNQLQLTDNALQSVFSNAANNNYAIDTTKKHQIKMDKAAIENTYEPQLASKKQEIKNLEAQYNTAVQTYKDEIERLENEIKQQKTTVGQRSESLSEKEKEYKDSVEARDVRYKKNLPYFVSMKNMHDSMKVIKLTQIRTLNDSLEVIRIDSAQAVADMQEYVADSTKVGKALESENDLLDNLNDILNIDENKISQDFDNEINDLQNDISSLQTQLQQQQQNMSQNLQGDKSANGLLVYYIPPPLEEIMQDKQKFEDLKEKVANAEQELKNALDNKKSVQSKLVRLFEKIARSLAKANKAGETKEDMDNEEQEAQDELSDAQNTQSGESKRLDEIENTADDAISTADNEINAIDLNSIITRINQLRIEAANKLGGIAQKLTELDQARSDRSNDNSQLESTRNDLTSKINELRQQRSSQHEKVKDLEKAENDLTRNQALNNQIQANAARQMAQNAESELQQVNDVVDNLRTQLENLASTHTNVTKDFREADSTMHIKLRELKEKLSEYEVIQDSLQAKNRQYQESLREIQHWRRTKEFAESLKERTGRARNMLSGQERQQLKELQEEVSRYKGQSNLAGQAVDDAKKIINAVKSEKDSLISEADDRIKAAEDSLKNAKKELRDFLVKEFNKVSFDVQIKLVVSNGSPAKFRSKDDNEELTKKLSYPGSRTPSFQSEPAKDNFSLKEKPGECQTTHTFLPDPQLSGSQPPRVIKPEPRTIALIYKDGEPLWPEWPVIPAKLKDYLGKDVVHVTGTANDNDRMKYSCLTKCDAPPEQIDLIEDLVTVDWSGDGNFISLTKNNPEMHKISFWEVPEIKEQKCEIEKELKTEYKANRIMGDPPKKEQSKPKIKPGVLIEVPDSLIGWPEHKKEIAARVVKGDHTGISGDRVEYSVTLTAGNAEDYGFDGTSKTTSITTDGQGYAKTEFNFGKGFAEFDITVKWFRGSEECSTETFPAKSPLYLRFLKVSAGIPIAAWNAAKDVWAGGSVDDAIAALEGADSSDLENSMHGVAGYHDEHSNFVNEETISFRPLGRYKINPDSMKTEMFGIAYTQVIDAPDGAQLSIRADCDNEYSAVCRPPYETGTFSTVKKKKFFIGIAGKEFEVEADEEFSPGETIEGTGKLVVMRGALNPALLNKLIGLSLDINEVFVEDEGGKMVAQAGNVSWQAPTGIEVQLTGYKVALDSLMLYAKRAAGIGGHLDHNDFEEKVGFEADFSPDGEFYGSVYNFPEMEFAGFKLRQGANFVIDWNSMKSPGDYNNSFKGIVVRTAQLELPAVFRNSETEEPALLTAEDFGLGTSGMQGKISIEGELINMGFAGFQLEMNKVELEFDSGDLVPQNAVVAGAVTPPDKIFDGTIEIEAKKAGNVWSANISTQDTILLSNLDLSIFFDKTTQISWDSDKELGTLVLNGVLISEHVGELSFDNLKVTSEGDITADAISLATDMSVVLGGFELHLDDITFSRPDGEDDESPVWQVEVAGGFGFPKIGVDNIEGAVIVKPGGVPSARLDKAEITFSRDPVEFKGSLSFTDSEFKGDFEVGVKKPNFSIDGLVIIGTMPIDDVDSYTYWYVELLMGTMITIPNTPMAILELGGGVGYNYDPPVGDQDGAPRNSNAFSFKAVAGIGTVPGGELINSRLTMVLTNEYFTLNGRLWVLQQENSMFGEGQLTLYWTDRTNKLVDGYMRSVIGVPDEDGPIVSFNGKINYEITKNDVSIESETLSGHMLKILHAEGSIVINSSLVDINGKLYYEFDEDISVGIGTLGIYIYVGAGGSFEYKVAQSDLTAQAWFKGNWDVDIETSFGSAKLISGGFDVNLFLHANPNVVEGQGTANVRYDVWIWSGSYSVDVGFKFT